MDRRMSFVLWMALLLGAVWRPQVLLAGQPESLDKTGAKNGIYCMDDGEGFTHAFFAETHKADGSLVFAVQANNGDFAYWAYVAAQKIKANHWRYTDADPDQKDNPDARCVIDIKFNQKSWVLVANARTPCVSHRGARAPMQAPPFPLASYIGPLPKNVENGPKEELVGDNLQIMANAGALSCSYYSRPYTQPYTLFPANPTKDSPSKP
jgi:hypothetical protein